MKNLVLKILPVVLLVLLFSALRFNNNKISYPFREYIVSSSKETSFVVYVFFTDKGPNAESKLQNPLSLVTQRSLDRRRKVLPKDKLVDITDVPLYEPYVQEVSKRAVVVRTHLRWLNAVSIEIKRDDLFDIADLDFVSKIEPVERMRLKTENNEQLTDAFQQRQPLVQDYPLVDSLNYGSGVTQISQITVNLVHNEGIYGQGVIIAHFDTGYDNLNHEVFTTLPMKILKKKDFQTGDTVNLYQNSHGQATLSLIGGYKPGSMIGPSFRAAFILCRTEVVDWERPIEMDYWAAAAQMADSMGADIISSSLGYLGFDPGYQSWYWWDMNGDRMPVSIAADYAAYKGIIVSNSAGNNGPNSQHNTLNGPADGDSVLTVGAVSSTGAIASFSSVGPTTDSINGIPAPRIKPDVLAQGVGNYVAGSTGYTSGSGTSFSCPLVSGVCGLVLSANKNLTPMQVIGILRKFGNNSSNPNNTYGWGIVNAKLSVDSARKLDNTPPIIIHTQPFTNTTNTGTITLKARVFDNGIIRYTRSGEAPRIYYRKNSGGGWTSYTSANYVSMNLDTFYFQIPGSSLNTQVEYYFAAQDIALPSPLVSTLPAGGSGVNPPGSIPPPTRFMFTVGSVSVVTHNNSVPNEFKLHQNYPNPFNPSTMITFDVKENSFVMLKIYDIGGRLMRTLLSRNMQAGSYSINFDGTDLPSGVYIARMTAGTFVDTKKMLLLK
ncbi:MAG: S8 family serine peptidase [Ignavibacteria bacterium]